MRRFVVLFCALLLAAAFTACGGDDEKKSCVHDWSDWTAAAAPTCTAAGTETRACSLCSESETRDDEARPALGHDYTAAWTVLQAPDVETDGEEARVCQADDCVEHTAARPLYATGTPGLAYVPIFEGTAYSVRRGTVTSGEVFLPAMRRPPESNDYNDYLPVVQIGANENTTDNTGAFQTGSGDAGVAITALRGGASVTNVGPQAFRGCVQLVSISLPAATHIGATAFRRNIALTTVDLPAAIDIGRDSFRDCAALVTLRLPEATTIGDTAFENCAALVTVDLPAATSIGAYAFWKCAALTELSLPAAIDIGGHSFRDCAALTELNLPVATTIGGSAFQDCAALSTINIPAATSIGAGAFRNCAALTELSLPAATSIGSNAFAGCVLLHTINMPSVMTITAANAFQDCNALARITVGGDLAAASQGRIPGTGFAAAYAAGGAGTYIRANSGTPESPVWSDWAKE